MSADKTSLDIMHIYDWGCVTLCGKGVTHIYTGSPSDMSLYLPEEWCPECLVKLQKSSIWIDPDVELVLFGTNELQPIEES